MADANIIVAVDHAIDVIEYLFSVKQEASIREISVATGMSNSSVHRQLLTLKERGYVYQNPETLKYWLGMRFYALGNLVKSNMPLVNLLSAALDALAEKYGLTTYLVLPDYSSDLCAQQAIVYKKKLLPYDAAKRIFNWYDSTFPCFRNRKVYVSLLSRNPH